MAEDDFYSDLAKARLEQIDAEMNQARAHLAIYKSNGDYGSASVALDELTELSNKRNGVVQLYNQQVASQQPQRQIPQTEGEYLAKAPERMNWGDTWQIASKSKYGVDENAFRAGMAEVQARKARNENQG